MMKNSTITPPLSFSEKIGYGFGDAASSMFWKLFTMYLMFFYTDVFGIPAAVVGTMFLVTRLWDATNDPLMGIIGDRTNTRWGKFRPYLLWIAVPFGIIGVLTFSTPGFGITGKIIYAYITYTLMMMVYTAINVPYAALMGVMSPVSKERTTLASYRFIFAFGGSILVLAAFQPLFDAFGSKTINTYSEKTTVEKSDSSFSHKDKIIYLWDSEFSQSNADDATDSLLYVTAKISTFSKDKFFFGVYDQHTGKYYWAEFAENKDTMGLERNGTQSAVNVKLTHLLPADEIHLKDLKVALSLGKTTELKCKNVSVKEIEYRSGTQKAVIVISSLAVLFFLLTFLLTREKIAPHKQETSIKQDLKDLSGNAPWFILLGAGVSTLIFNSLRDGSIVYYFKYYIKSGNAWEFMLFSKEIAFTYSTLFMVLGQVSAILGVILAKPVSNLLGKKQTFFFAMLFSAVFSFIFYTFSPDDLLLIYLFQVIISTSAGIIFPLLWSMYADIADYSEWKTGRRATGLVFSSSSMSQKFGWTLGGALTGWLLAGFGYEANMVQAPDTLNGLKLMMSVIPGIGALVSACFIFFYKLDKNFLKTIETELKKKRSADE